MAYVPSTELLARLADGDTRAAGRLITRAESGADEARDALAQVYHRAGRSHIVGITGVAGQRQVDAGRQARAPAA